jgi:hypothetical protein
MSSWTKAARAAAKEAERTRWNNMSDEQVLAAAKKLAIGGQGLQWRPSTTLATLATPKPQVRRTPEQLARRRQAKQRRADRRRQEELMRGPGPEEAAALAPLKRPVALPIGVPGLGKRA